MDTNDRDLNTGIIDASDNTLEKCFEFCRIAKFKYAGVQNGQDCWCSYTFRKHGTASNCDKPCTGNGKQICGGWYANNIYDLLPGGVASTKYGESNVIKKLIWGKFSELNYKQGFRSGQIFGWYKKNIKAILCLI